MAARRIAAMFFPLNQNVAGSKIFPNKLHHYQIPKLLGAFAAGNKYAWPALPD
jgi:hypothetical protein